MNMSPQTKTISSYDGSVSAEINLAGGIMHSLYYHGNAYNKSLPILYRAPWLNEKEIIDSINIPTLLKRLAGEWVAVPFGGCDKDDGYFYANAPHGLPVSQQWQWQQCDNHQLTLTFTYPESYPLQKLIRTIAMQDNGKVEFSLTIIPREDCQLPIGLHPIFPLDGELGNLEVDIASFLHGIVYPTPAESGVSQLHSGAIFDSLNQIPTKNKTYIDITRLPLSFNTEEIVQIIQPKNGIRLRYPKHKLQVLLAWDTQVLPDCLLWISNRGRTATPWLGRNCCIGVEPICSAWDLGPDSFIDNKINTWSPTFISFRKNQDLTLNYHIQCENY